MTYQQEKRIYDAKITRLNRVKFLDEGPNKGVPVKVSAIYSLSFYDEYYDYKVSECVASGPFEANFNDRYVINNQVGDYNLYLLDTDLDSKQRIIVIKRGCTVKIIKDWGLVLTLNYNCTPESVRNIAAFLAPLILKDDKTLDESLLELRRPKDDKPRSDF